MVFNMLKMRFVKYLITAILEVWVFISITGSVNAQVVVADHTVISQFDNGILDPYVESASAANVFFNRASTGGFINGFGLNCLAGGTRTECLKYVNHIPAYDNYNWDWIIWDPTIAGTREKVNQFVNNVHTKIQSSNPDDDYDFFGMKICYLEAGDSGENVQYYIDKMNQLEQSYPNKRFIWTTGVLLNESQSFWDLTKCRNQEAFNNTVRAYAKSHGKLLYDMADIESHDPSGNRCYSVCESMCSEYQGAPDKGANGHPNVEGALRLAKGFWYLMVKATNSSVPTPPPGTIAPTNPPSSSPTPQALLGDTNNDGYVNEIDYSTWLSHYGQSISGENNGNFNNDSVVDGLDFIIWLSNFTG